MISNNLIGIRIVDDAVQRKLQLMAAHATNTAPAMAGISMVMLGEVENNFRAEGRPTKWKALTASTLATRAARGTSGKILQAKGHLARSITPFSSNNVGGVGTNVPYAPAMNNGSKPHVIKAKNKKALYFGGRFAKKVNHPGTAPRPFMVLTDRGQSDCLKVMAAHIASGG
ncbi:phage virion morphogenesis protein [Herminiimonas arsenitoxidans]|uniref:phage virion morphogenesis protein n=1 Tax=Herminiimonas arsenitoxidans TaxID=1809410 RepID=UPI0009F842FD|nr:phage virion morphogenesis protein [Herminiimonas arsenitoxidans]